MVDQGESRRVRIGLIACTKQKQPYACAAREMYLPSPLFRKASAYCGQEYDSWYILSAKYGLLSPEDIIEPYDRTLRTMSRAECKEWGQQVSSQLAELGDHDYFAHAGSAYLKPLCGVKIVNVLAGLRIGERLHWYGEQLAGVADTASDMQPIHGSHELEGELTFERLARASRWYRDNTRFNDSYVRLLGMDSFLNKLRTRPNELTSEDVLNELITGFLNRWRCRVPKTPETARAIRSRLIRVAGAISALAADNLLHVDLSYGATARRNLIAETYEILQTVDRVGPTTASKILHILNPALFVMWDRAIRQHYSALLGRSRYGEADYVAFLAHMQEMAESVVGDFSCRHGSGQSAESYLSAHLGLDRPVTLAKFLDEYNWVTIVRGVRTP